MGQASSSQPPRTTAPQGSSSLRKLRRAPGEANTTGELQEVKVKAKLMKSPSVVARIVSSTNRQRALTFNQDEANRLQAGGQQVTKSDRVIAMQRSVRGSSALGTSAAPEQPSRIGKMREADFVSDDGRRRISIQKARASFVAALGKSPLLSQTSMELRERLFKEAVSIFVTKGDVLFEKGSYSQIMFVVVQGALAYVNRKDKLREQAVAEHCVLVSLPHEATCMVVESGVVLAVHRFQYQLAAVRVAEQQQHKDLSKAQIHVALFAPLTAAVRAQLLQTSSLAEFRAGQRIVAANDVLKGLYIILSGSVALSASSPSKRERAEEFTFESPDEYEWLSTGDHFGEAALLSSEGVMGVDVTCSREGSVRCLLISPEAFRATLQHADETGFMVDLLSHLHLVRLLEHSPLFSHLSDAEIAALAKLAVLVEYAPGATIHAGGPLTHMYMVVFGVVKLQAKLEGAAPPDVLSARARLLKEKSSSLAAKSDALLDSKTKAHQLQANTLSFSKFTPDLLGIESQTEDHEAIFGVQDSYALLGAGNTFGENAIKYDEAALRTLRSAASALGNVKCARIDVDVLKNLGVLDKVRQGFEQLEGPVMSAVPQPADDLVKVSGAKSVSEAIVKAKAAGGSSNSLSTRFMAFSKLKLSEMDAQEKSEKALKRVTQPNSQSQSNDDSGKMRLSAEFRPSVTPTSRNASIPPFYFKVEMKRLVKLTELHRTSLVTVYLAMHTLSHQLVVVKCLNVEVANDQSMGHYVLTEQVVLAQLSSSFVANMVATWEEPKRLYIALEPALGGDLSELLLNAGQPGNPMRGSLGGLRLDLVTFAAACMVLALKHLFERDIMHRDIKPANVLMDHHGYCKLTDFGIAKSLLNRTTRTQSVVGSPKYMSPELASLWQGQGQPYSHTTDWWSLGITLFELCVGYTPFAGKSWMLGPDLISDVMRRVSAYRNSAQGADLSLRKDHPVFVPFSQDPKWAPMHDFVCELMSADGATRLGCIPREALKQRVFEEGILPGGDFWARLHSGDVAAPFVVRFTLPVCVSGGVGWLTACIAPK